ncbi:D-alanyl-D-alanine carboxypeptidase family protein [Wenjunlia tyrosinilytica]|uniref:D-alanyl-D-alanine carboxypeptidase n=1 Tax=Wenjunlia tyrosinilytica TaxID=1544741 RepID=A0A917ZID9_9ACTN|nr:D-alanyl-D-alanine carboxypeptidase [Wenjunlia tyrosinilytica]GGO83348.1 D-alanyl-D-alanine carboxypeptidase [Wenjunlia tyrosinilytica]
MRLSNTAAAAALTAAALLAPAGRAAAAHDESDHPNPPKRMSALGGDLLGKRGTQVHLAPGAPRIPKGLTGLSWIVADAESGEVLASHNAHWRLAPASTLKMLFADTVLPKFPRDAEHKVTLADLADVQAGSSLVGVKEDFSYTVHDMWLGVFLASGNDAVHVLAAMNGGVRKTVEEMQAEAENLRAHDTHVVSPDGFDAPGQVSSAYDLTLFARAGLQNPDFREYCGTATAKFPGGWVKTKKGKDDGKGGKGDDKPGGSRAKNGKGGAKGKARKREMYAIQNTNRLLTGAWGMTPYRGLIGVKNGYTSHAGNTFTGAAQRGGRTLLVTVMHPESGGNNVYEEASDLLDWGFKAAGKVDPVGVLVAPKTVHKSPANPGDKGNAPHGAHQKGSPAGGPEAGLASSNQGSAGMWTALGLAGGTLALLGGAVLVVHRRWPLPDLVGGVRKRERPGGRGPGPDSR